MLSLEDVKNVSFRKAKFGGYRPEDVDAFIDDMQISYEELLREREEMTEKIKKMRSFVDRFQAENVSIKDVILNAKNIAQKSLSEAEIESRNMIEKATNSSKKMIEDAKKEVTVQGEIAKRIRSESIKMKEKLEDIYKSHMKLIKNIPAEVEKIFPKEIKTVKSDSDKRLTPEEKVNRIIGAASVDIFSEPVDEDANNDEVKSSVRKKFRNLEFGENYNPGSEENEDSQGLYNGIFEK